MAHITLPLFDHSSRGENLMNGSSMHSYASYFVIGILLASYTLVDAPYIFAFMDSFSCLVTVSRVLSVSPV